MNHFRHMFVAGCILLLWMIPALAQDDATPEPEPKQLLAWVAPGTVPGGHSADNSGEIVLIDADGNRESILSIPSQVMRVIPCGTEAASPDGSAFTFFIGNESNGTLYLLTGEVNTLLTLSSDVNAMACTGMGTLQYSADSSQIAYLDYADTYSTDISPTGRLIVAETETGDQIDNFENVAAFNLAGEVLTYVAFYSNSDGEAVEVAINTNDGDRTDEVVTLFADEENDCFFNSASVSAQVDDQIAAVLGYRCNQGDIRDTQWQFYTIDTAARNATLAQSGTTIGRFFPHTRTNLLFTSPDGETAFFSVPDGLNNRSVGIKAVDLDALTVTNVVAQNALMPSVSALPYDADNHTPLLSPDGRWLALVTNDGNNSANLNVIDLNAPNLPPINISAGSRGDTITEMAFDAESEILYFVAGANRGGDNVLFELDLASGNATRLSRGHYDQGVLRTDDNTMAIINWHSFADDEAPQLTIEQINLEDNDSTVLFESGTIVDGELTNAEFAYPLAWR